jgi:arsenate reductase-like glutaredoxin family protein
MTCQRAQGFLEKKAVKVEDRTDATKNRKGREEALALAKAADNIVVVKGKKVVEFDMKKDRPDDETLIAYLLGPTGNLRAPTMRKGKTLLVGFNDDSYRAVLNV